MGVLNWILGSTLIISLIAFVGAFFLTLKKKVLNKILLIIIAFAAGALIGGAFLHMLPEASELATASKMFLLVVVGFVIFFLLENLLYWRHCHKGKCPVHPFSYLNLIGDGIHNFTDGLIVAASFVASIPVGIATAIAIAAHEIPQEIGDISILIYGGFKRAKALILNFLIALTVVLGGLIGYFISASVKTFSVVLLPLAAGGFIYIAASDLIPLIKGISERRRSALTFLAFLAGIALLWLVKLLG